MTDVKLCKDCKHARKPFMGMPTPFRPWAYARCHAVVWRPSYWRAPLALVDGQEPKGEFLFCQTHRDCKASERICGPEATMFEPRA